MEMAHEEGIACTCGGIPISHDGVGSFVGSIASVLSSDGIAVFDQEGGWPFGLERLLREACAGHGLQQQEPEQQQEEPELQQS